MKTFFQLQISDKSAAPIRTMSFPLSSRLVICQIFSLLQMEWEEIKREIMLTDIR